MATAETPSRPVLLVDDDQKLARLLTQYLAQFGFALTAKHHPVEALAYLEQARPQLVILDIMLPGIDGLEVCRRIRAFSNVPVIMLTARGELSDRVLGLELGADDYLPKPFEARELVARMEALLRRGNGFGQGKTLLFGELSIDPKHLSARMGGQELALTSSEFQLLLFLANHAGQVQSRDEILTYLRGFEADAFNRTVDILLSRLRQKLGDDPKHPRFIKTLWGEGYLFLG